MARAVDPVTVIDTRSLSKCPQHDGKEESWQEFSFKFDNYMALLGWKPFMDEYMEQVGHVLMDDLGARAQQVSYSLYAVLAQVLSGRFLSVLRLIAQQHGLRAWKELKQEFEPQSGNRSAALLRAILNPQVTWQKELRWDGIPGVPDEVGVKFVISQYRLLSGEALSDAILVAIVLEHAPEHLREMLRQAHESVKTSYAALKSHLREYQVSSKVYHYSMDSHGIVPGST
eukprot:4212598-Amphidinium_carterae.1